MKRKRRPKGFTESPEIRSDKIQSVIHVCLICGTPTGETSDWRRSDVDCEEAFGSADPKMWQVRKGVCPNCQKQRDEGCVLMFSDTRGVILNPEAAAKLKPEYRDCILKIPEERMDDLLSDTRQNSTETN